MGLNPLLGAVRPGIAVPVGRGSDDAQLRPAELADHLVAQAECPPAATATTESRTMAAWIAKQRRTRKRKSGG